jgi:DNA modification methylase
MCKNLDADGHLPATLMVMAPGSWNTEVWDDINRMMKLNTTQSQRRQALHVCPLQFQTVDRLINRYSNEGELVFDPFGGIGTVPLRALKLGRRGLMTELNADYFRDAVGYLNAEEEKIDTPTLFDFFCENEKEEHNK